jgi:hypothetical protein
MLSKFLTRKFLLRLIVVLLSLTAVLGIISVLWTGLGETGTKILISAIAADAASVLALCCTGRTTSALHRTIQVTGILSACAGFATAVYGIWFDVTVNGVGDGILRATAVCFILAASSAHASLVLPLRSYNRPMRIVVTGTVLCIAAAAELIANYVLFPNFSPGSAYDRALAVILILDALGTILILLMHRFGPPRAGAVPARAPARNPSPDPAGAKLPSVP